MTEISKVPNVSSTVQAKPIENVNNQPKVQKTMMSKNNISKDTIQLSAKEGTFKDKISGTINGQKAEIKAQEKLSSRIISGEMEGEDFEIKHKSKSMKGHIGKQEVNLDIKRHSFWSDDAVITGSVDGKEVKLISDSSFGNKNIKGIYKDKSLELLVASGFEDARVIGEYDGKPINLKMKSNGFFKNGYEVKGDLGEESSLLPILMSNIYDIQAEQAAAATLMVM